MSIAELDAPLPALLSDANPRRSRSIASRLSAYRVLAKPRIATMVLLTVFVGFVLGARASSRPITLVLTLVGTGMVAAGASAWNQVIERRRDGLMKRTESRPLPAGVITPLEAALVGGLCAAGGVGLLVLAANTLAAAVAAATFILYVAVYTPLKPVSTLNTAVGAIPGALPPVIGWTAATGQMGIEAWVLFLIVFLWQFPHFFAIAWIHREDYARGGHAMLPVIDPGGFLTGRQATTYALALIPVGLMPAAIGLAAWPYFLGAGAAGIYYLIAAICFWRKRDHQHARRLLRASIIYLPLILLLLVLNPLPA